jgi:3-mercaptopyruvate sulfurtransferase SseA
MSINHPLGLDRWGEPVDRAAVRRIATRALKTMRDLGRDMLLIDLRPREIFEAGHIPGAEPVPFARDFDENVGRWLAGWREPLVIYGEEGSRVVLLAARRLTDLGFELVFVFDGGFEEWVRAGLPVELPLPKHESSTPPAQRPTADHEPVHKGYRRIELVSR